MLAAWRGLSPRMAVVVHRLIVGEGAVEFVALWIVMSMLGTV